MTSNEDLERHAARLREVLREQFQYDRSDLDFGIYRILNQRREDIEHFLDKDLIPSVETTIADSGVAEADRGGLAAQVCADLSRFFERYYESGDFLPLRRYRPGTYAVPYEGEEVLLHWANKDQYYVKSSERLSGYTFALPDGRTVRFAIIATDEDSQGNKPAPGEDRRYALADPPVVSYGEDELVVRWEFVAKKKGVKQADLNAEAEEALLDNREAAAFAPALQAPAEGNGDDGPTVLAKHIGEFTARQSHDYFIHRDLGGFLRQELGAFLGSEVLSVAEAGKQTPEDLHALTTRVGTAKTIGDEIIDFLHQVEDFQRRIWLKQKLIVGTSYLVTLDLVPEKLYPEIMGNQDQLDAWEEQLAADELDGWPDVDADFLAANPGLVLDTAYFDDEFYWSLLGAQEDLDEVTIGTAINGDCFHALRLLSPRYRGQVQASYIDPPYNTGGGDFLYKDRYQHSSWLSMMRDRLALGRGLLADDGVQFVSIDDDEHPRLRLALDTVFGAENFVANVVWQKKYSPSNDAKWFSDDHDHLVVAARRKDVWRPGRFPRTPETDSGYTNPDDDPRGPWMSGDYIQAKSRDERPNGWYGIERPQDGELIWPNPAAVWRYTPEQHQENVNDNRVWWGADGGNSKPRYKRFLSEVGGLVPRTIWTHTDAGHNQDAVRDLQGLFGSNPFRNPKPVKLLRRILTVAPGDLVLDYFAGSGTLGHAAIEERREGTEQRTFLLAEQGPHFESVLWPRLVKVLHAGSWKRGAPEDRNHVTGMIKLITLESCDDALDSLELTRSDGQAALLDSAGEIAREYTARYMLEAEGRPVAMDPEIFKKPFAAETYSTWDGERQKCPIDLAETFSYLLGLTPRKYHHDPGLLAIRGSDPADQEVLVIWRDEPDVDDEALAAWVLGLPDELRGPELSRIYVNGDTDLQRRRPEGERWEVLLSEDEFIRLMFDDSEQP